MKPGIGARLEASFRPSVHWGAEFLADRVRICGLKDADGKVVLADSFEGPYAEVEAFARDHGLAFEGMHAAVSHIPFKLEVLEPMATGSEDDIAPQAERFKPAGLSMDSLDLHGFDLGGNRYLVMAREDGVRGFAEHLPAPLAALWNLVPSPLALLSHADSAAAPDRMAALLVEEGHTHVLFLRGGFPEAYAKAFTGCEEARRDPEAFAREMKKVLVYHHGSKFPGASLEALSIWRDGSEGEAGAALSKRDLPIQAPAWLPGLESVPASLKVAGALALQGLRGAEPLVSLSIPRPQEPQSRRLWMRRSGLLARSGYHVVAAVAVLTLLLMASAAVFRKVVEAKAVTWSGELQKWDQFQARRATVEKRLEKLQGLLVRRTDGYASLQRISSLLPPEVWLEEWEAESGAEGRYVHRLTGYSLSEARVPQFLAKLEDGKGFQSVKLKSTERIKGDKVEKETGIQANRKDLIRFQMVVSE